MSATAETMTTPHPSTSYRTLAYTGSVGFLLVWMVVLAAYHINHIEEKIISVGVVGEVNHLLGALATSVLLPLTVVLPPVFHNRKTRLKMSLCLNLVTCLVLMVYLVTGVVWAIMCPICILMINLLVLSTQQLTTIMLLACLTTLSRTTIRKYQGVGVTGIDSAVGTNQSLRHGSQVFLVVGTALLSSVGEGLDSDRATSSTEYSAMLPFFLITLLLVVQVKHYTRSHVGWFTRRRATKRVSRYIKHYPLSELEKDLLCEKKLAEKLIEGAFTANIYPRPSCPL